MSLPYIKLFSQISSYTWKTYLLFYININIETMALIAGNLFHTLTMDLSVAYGNILYKVLNGFYEMFINRFE